MKTNHPAGSATGTDLDLDKLEELARAATIDRLAPGPMMASASALDADVILALIAAARRAPQPSADRAPADGALELPPLPRNYGRFNINGPDEHRIRGWTSEQMQDYGRACYAIGRGAAVRDYISPAAAPADGAPSLLRQMAKSASPATRDKALDLAIRALEDIEASTAAPADGAGGRDRARALHAAVAAIYFDDSSDFRSALGSVVRYLDPTLAGDLLGNPKAAYDEACARLDRAPTAGDSTSPQPGAIHLCSPFPGMDEPWEEGKLAELDAALAPYETDAPIPQPGASYEYQPRHENGMLLPWAPLANAETDQEAADYCVPRGFKWRRAAAIPQPGVDEAALFEAWFVAALRRTYPHMPESGVQRMLSKHADGTYTDLTTQHDWSVWLASVARAALTRRAPQAGEDARDEKRLNWIEQKVAATGSVWILPSGDKNFVQLRHAGHTANYPTVTGGVRAAIDAAMAAPAQRNGGDQ